jgi:hypothetical protein
MSKKQTPPVEPVAAVAAAPADEQPKTGGCWIRNADGSLSRDTAEHPEEAEKAEEQAP